MTLRLLHRAFVAVMLLGTTSPAFAEGLDVIVSLQVDEAGNVKDVFAEPPAIRSFMQAINWDAIAKTIQAEGFDDIALLIKGRSFRVTPGLFNTQSARQNMRQAGLDNGYSYSLNVNTKDDEDLNTRLRIAAIVEENLQTINLRREGPGNPVNAVDIEIRRAADRPDLALSLGAAEFIAEESALTIELAVENVGQRASPPTTAMIFELESRTRLAAVDIERLGPGRGVKTNAQAKIPREWLGDSRQVEVRVDPGDTILELNEDNNARTSQPVQLGQPLRPDLVISSAEAKFDELRNMVVMAVLVTNTGTARSPESRIAVREQASGTPVRSAVVPVLNAGENFEAMLDIAVPDDWRSRAPRFLVDVDPGQLIFELREDNNRGISGQVDLPPMPPEAPQQPPEEPTLAPPVEQPEPPSQTDDPETDPVDVIIPERPEQPAGYGLTTILIVALGAAVLAAIGTALFVGRRGGQVAPTDNSTQGHAHVPTLRARAGTDPGHQLVEAGSGDIRLPALSIRPRRDSGHQQLDAMV